MGGKGTFPLKTGCIIHPRSRKSSTKKIGVQIIVCFFTLTTYLSILLKTKVFRLHFSLTQNFDLFDDNHYYGYHCI